MDSADLNELTVQCEPILDRDFLLFLPRDLKDPPDNVSSVFRVKRQYRLDQRRKRIHPGQSQN